MPLEQVILLFDWLNCIIENIKGDTVTVCCGLCLCAMSSSGCCPNWTHNYYHRDRTNCVVVFPQQEA